MKARKARQYREAQSREEGGQILAASRSRPRLEQVTGFSTPVGLGRTRVQFLELAGRSAMKARTAFLEPANAWGSLDPLGMGLEAGRLRGGNAWETGDLQQQACAWARAASKPHALRGPKGQGNSVSRWSGARHLACGKRPGNAGQRSNWVQAALSWTCFDPLPGDKRGGGGSFSRLQHICRRFERRHPPAKLKQHAGVVLRNLENTLSLRPRHRKVCTTRHYYRFVPIEGGFPRQAAVSRPVPGRARSILTTLQHPGNR